MNVQRILDNVITLYYNVLKEMMIMSQATIIFRIDSEDKKRFEEFCDDTGMNVSVAINMFIKAVLRDSRLPFAVESRIPNETTVAAIREGEEMLKDPKTRRFKSVDELFEELETE